VTSAKKDGPATEVKIRRARASDAGRIAELSGQLGYPATDRQIEQRLSRLLPTSAHLVLVAELPGVGVIGWLHASLLPLLESDARAEINGLVVADGHRGVGAGATMLEAAEQWARRRGCKHVNLRSNVVRDLAHAFYLRQGYDHYKTQKAFRKAL
jgi:GNAT superfamily N-acetyltransferase